MKTRHIATALGIACLIGGVTSTGAFEVAEIGSFHVGGQIVELEGLPKRDIVFTAGSPPVTIDPNGTFQAGQMYAQYVKLASPRARYPLLMWHGGGLTGVTWETTPDGRPGWQMFFLDAGYDVYVSDAVERGRAGWARFPEILPGEPVFRTMGEGWNLFRVGPQDGWAQDEAERVAYEGTQFPIDAWNQFTKQSVPRWTTTDPLIQAAYDALVQKVCPCVIILHSQGSNFGFHAALTAPDKVKAIVAVEPSGAPNPTADDAALVKDVPHLVVWGDYFDKSPFWQKLRTNITAWQDAIEEAGGTADVLDLPARGIHGNSHMLMMDRNSDEVAALIQAWLEEQGMMR
jgi:pimeloyl-ACP methyl ester carboxylesterase